MSMFNVGEFIQKTRKQKGITQEQLAHPFMDRSHISKIERGLVAPDKKTLETLLERLGTTPMTVAEYFMSDDEVRMQKQWDKLEGQLTHGRLEDAKGLMEKLDEENLTKEPLNHQKLLLYKGIFTIQSDNNLELARQYFLDAIHQTIPTFNEDDIKNYLLSKTDLLILNNLILIYKMQGEMERGVELMYQLKENFEERFADNRTKGTSYTLILFNLTKALCELERYQEAVELCDFGKKVCLDLGNTQVLPSLIAIKANALHEMGDFENAKKLFKQAYHGYEMQEDFTNRNAILEYVDEQKIAIDF